MKFEVSHLQLLFYFLSVGLGFWAAYVWYLSAKGSVVINEHERARRSKAENGKKKPAEIMLAQGDDTWLLVHETFIKQGRLSATAAFLTGLSVLMSAIGTFIGAFL